MVKTITSMQKSPKKFTILDLITKNFTVKQMDQTFLINFIKNMTTYRFTA